MNGRKLTDIVIPARDEAPGAANNAEIIRLTAEDQSLVAEALRCPPEPVDALRRAFQRREILLASTPEPAK